MSFRKHCAVNGARRAAAPEEPTSRGNPESKRSLLAAVAFDDTG